VTCRHSDLDPACGSFANRVARAKQIIAKSQELKGVSTTPDSERYEIVDALRVGEHLVLKVKYPNCANCTYEGNKVMVFLNVTEAQVLKWRRIDPHFADPEVKRSPTEAPSPAARFPASAAGWSDACLWARSRVK
jgi:hypothetical protein